MYGRRVRGSFFLQELSTCHVVDSPHVTLWCFDLEAEGRWGDQAAAKRFKISGNGKVLSRRPGKQHINEKKSSKRLSQLSREKRIPNSELDNVIGCLPYAGIQK